MNIRASPNKFKSSVQKSFAEVPTYVSAGLDFSKQVLELPVHVSTDGFVIPPIPKGKVVKN
jgi:hypothetical protein